MLRENESFKTMAPPSFEEAEIFPFAFRPCAPIKESLFRHTIN